VPAKQAIRVAKTNSKGNAELLGKVKEGVSHTGDQEQEKLADQRFVQTLSGASNLGGCI
jgi:hypothetical protein